MVFFSIIRLGYYGLASHTLLIEKSEFSPLHFYAKIIDFSRKNNPESWIAESDGCVSTFLRIVTCYFGLLL